MSDKNDDDVPFEWEGYVTVSVLSIGLVIMFLDKMRTEFVMMGVLVTLVIAQIIDLKSSLDGFSNSSLLAVMALFAVAEGITQTGALEAFFKRVLGRPSSSPAAQIRMMFPVGFVSAFLNNTPVVALMIPIVSSWSRAIRISPGQLMIPLSYISELGGVCTLIGTSTNLIVKGLYDDAAAVAAEAGESLVTISIFSQSLYGVPICICGMLYIILLGRRILPGNVTNDTPVEEEPLQVGMLVTDESPVIAKQVHASGLLHMDNLRLVHILRDGALITQPQLQTAYLRVYDTLYVAGDMRQVDALAAQLHLTIITDDFEFSSPIEGHESAAQTLFDTPSDRGSGGNQSVPLLTRPGGLEIAEPASTLARLPRTAPNNGSSAPPIIKLVHATVKESAPIAGQTIKDARFRTRFDAAVVHVRRAGQKLEGPLGLTKLQSGDEILMSAGSTFSSTTEDAAANFTDVRPVKAPYKQFMMPMTVPEASHMIGKSIQDAGLRGLQDGFVVAIQQGSVRVHAVSPDVRLQAGDVIWFAGDGAKAIHALRNIKGLQPQNKAPTSGKGLVHMELVQAVVSRTSPLVGKTLVESNFDSRYGCIALALHRDGERIMSDMNAIPLQTGDVLLLEAPGTFAKTFDGDESFALVSVIAGATPTKWNRSVLALALVVVMVVLQVVQSVLDVSYVPLLASAAAVVGIMLLSGCMSTAQVHKCLKWDIYLTIAAALGVSNALRSSGTAALIANGLIDLGEKLGGDVAIQAALYIATAFLSNIIANNAAAALLFPIVLDVSKKQGIRLDLLAFLLMFGASSAFTTPYGYQTNMMVQDVGGYKPMHYARFGGPMQIWQGVATVAIMAVPQYWYITWIVVGGLSAIVFLPHLMSVPKVLKFKRHAAKEDTQMVDTPAGRKALASDYQLGDNAAQ